ncbi:PAS domain S-box-containing protein/diguanylate cyclase (GGDEF) domain-containing protein [Roseateles sp. YR242]|uniref:sensor domain-containing diguanylate cyclase n=1 Tax=Roseateles sp. YR242 TaxID=1855305 RepID=UPI0008BD8B81|nr:diguanylate cyclase [Roseateles sp. YR242]SEL65869.1 PAS domain S-box-containing protein/diguanylate cyclase (GGDEF) domain-containing protein [Roseateles sp. YR242]
MDRLLTTPPRSLRKLAIWLVVTNIIVIGVIVVATTLALRASRTADHTRARETTENLASTLAIDIGAELKQVDNALATIALHYRRANPQDPAFRHEIERAIADQRSLLPQVDVIRVTDAQGHVVYGLAAEEGHLQVADRDYFQHARNSAGMVISEPLYGRLFRKWGVILARRLENERGEFAGVVYTDLSSQHFVSNFSRLAIGTEGAISLRTRTLHLIARHSVAEPDSNRGIGEVIVSEDLLASMAKDPSRGAYFTRTRIDNIERITAYRAVRDYPLIVLAGAATSDFLSAWRGEAQQQALLAGIVICTVLACSVVVYRQQRREQRAREQIARLAREQSLMLDNDLVGMARVRHRVAIWKNRALDSIFGFSGGEIVGQPSRFIYLDDESHESTGRLAAEAFSRGQRFRTQLRMRRKDGSPVWIDMSGAPVSADESLWMMIDISALKESEAMAHHLAVHDALTGLPNRVRFTERLAGALTQLDERHGLLAVCYIDLDGFKAVNDRFGHDAGDAVLREVAQRLLAGIRSQDVVARLGGDELGLLLASLRHEREAVPTLQRLLAAIHHPVVLPGGGQAQVGASIGIAFAPRHGRQADGLLRMADAAMYLAKRQGKHQIVVANGLGAPTATSTEPDIPGMNDISEAPSPPAPPAAQADHADHADHASRSGHPGHSDHEPGVAGTPAPVPDHAFEESVAGEEDPGASLDEDASKIPPPRNRT